MRWSSAPRSGMRRVRRGAGPVRVAVERRGAEGMTTGAEGGRPKRSSNSGGLGIRSSGAGPAPAGIRQAVNPARAERRRRLRLWSGSAPAMGWTIAVCQRRHTDCPDATSIRAPRARPFALCSARPLSKGSATEKTGKPWGRSEHGAMTRVRRRARARRSSTCPPKLEERRREERSRGCLTIEYE